MPQRIVLLNGLRKDDQDLTFCLDYLLEEIQVSNAAVQVYTLGELQTGTCIGCFGCWVKTPGVCIEPDIGRDIAEAVVRSDVTILLTPIVFGGYSSEIKKIQDRWLPLVLPYFGVFHDEIHHLPRYSHYPRLVAFGLQRQPNQEEANLFKILVGRNALNFHSPTHAAEVLLATTSPDLLRSQIRATLLRSESAPSSQVMETKMRALEAHLGMPLDSAASPAPGRALLLIGSPKVKSPSTSGVLGGYLLDRLEEKGWETKTLTLRGQLFKSEHQAEWLADVDQADLLVLAFPLYIDALPALMTRALEVLANHLTSQAKARPKHLAVLCNNGFPEPYPNAVALSICHQFAAKTGLVWSGGLALAAGEAIIRGQPLTGERQGSPPVPHVIEALDLAGAALAAKQTIPAEAQRLMAKVPIPLMPLSLWRRLFIKMAGWHWRQAAASNQADPDQLKAQPYALHR
ncbi:MAG: hypothetical protein HC929_16245 [Leptolyngbyaceae cyanobacterium SM2_5_2]|nr:hypothetical protein [Leptolyngbyaceae cyanobacterium SM2_5_2]